MLEAERQRIRQAIALIHKGTNYDTGIQILCGLARIESPEFAEIEQPVVLKTRSARLSTKGKPCECGDGIGAHRNSAGAAPTFCRRCSCVQYQPVQQETVS